MRQRCGRSHVGTFLVIGLLFVGAVALAADQVPAAAPATQTAPAPAAQPAPAPAPAPDAKATAAATAAPVGVQINRNCIATPARAEITYPDGEVEWTFTKNAAETAAVIAKPKAKQDPTDPVRGEKIKKLFNARYDFAAGVTKANSGKAQGQPPYKGDKGVAWRYTIELYDAAGKTLCSVDPDVCIRGPGGAGCDI